MAASEALKPPPFKQLNRLTSCHLQSLNWQCYEIFWHFLYSTPRSVSLVWTESDSVQSISDFRNFNFLTPRSDSQRGVTYCTNFSAKTIFCGKPYNLFIQVYPGGFHPWQKIANKISYYYRFKQCHIFCVVSSAEEWEEERRGDHPHHPHHHHPSHHCQHVQHILVSSGIYGSNSMSIRWQSYVRENADSNWTFSRTALS